MALKEPFMVFYGENQSEYTLSPGYNEGIIIKKIYVPRPVNDFLVIHIQKTMVGFWSLGAVTPGNNLYLYGRAPYPYYTAPYETGPMLGGLPMCEENVYNYFVEKGLFRPYRVAEGETIIFRTLNGASFDLILVYEVYDADDVDPSEPNGSKSDEYDFVNYVYPSDINIGENVIDSTWNPSEFPSFPVGERVPAEYQIVIWGIAGLPVYYRAGSTLYFRTNTIKFIRNRKVLFDEQKKGIPFYGAPEGVWIGEEFRTIGCYNTVVRGHSHIDQHHALVLPQPLTCEPGEELEMRLVCDGNYEESWRYLEYYTIALLETVKRVR